MIYLLYQSQKMLVLIHKLLEDDSKMRGTNQKLKLLYLKEIFEEETDNEHTISMPRIIEELKKKGVAAERKSIYDDIRLLQDEYGLPIEHEEGARTYRLAEHLFEFSELKLIIDTIASSKTLTEKKSQQLIDKLKTLCSRPQRDTLWSQIIVTDRAKTQNNEVHYNIDILNTAIALQRKVDFQYFYYDVNKKRIFSFGGRHYHVTPYAMIYTDNNYYLLAIGKWGERKHFRVDRMTNVQVSRADASFDRKRAKIDLSEYTKYTFSMYDGKLETVKMRFENNLASMVLDRFGHDTLLMKEDDEHFTVTTPIYVSDQFIGWMFGLGEKAEILEPESVRKKMRKRLEEMNNMYK